MKKGQDYGGWEPSKLLSILPSDMAKLGLVYFQGLSLEERKISRLRCYYFIFFRQHSVIRLLYFQSIACSNTKKTRGHKLVSKNLTLENNLKIGQESKKSGKFFCLKIGRNKIFIMQRGYGNKLYEVKIVHLCSKRLEVMKQIHLFKKGFVIFLKGAMFSDFIDARLLNCISSGIKIRFPLFWRIFFQLGSRLINQCLPHRLLLHGICNFLASFKPRLQVFEALDIGDIVDQHDCVCAIYVFV